MLCTFSDKKIILSHCDEKEDIMYNQISVSFPGIGIGEGTINSVAFSIGENFAVMWYGICIAFGMLMAIAYASWRCNDFLFHPVSSFRPFVFICQFLN